MLPTTRFLRGWLRIEESPPLTYAAYRLQHMDISELGFELIKEVTYSPDNMVLQ